MICAKFKSTDMNLFETTQSVSKFEAVSWNIKRNLWQAKFYINSKVKKFYFDNEFDAAKKLNLKLCGLPNQQVAHI